MINKPLEKIDSAIAEKLQQFETNNPILLQTIHHIIENKPINTITLLSSILCYKLAPYIAHIDTEIKNLFHETLHQPEIQKEILLDLLAIKDRDPASDNYLNILLNYKGFHATTMHRISHLIWRNQNKELALYLANLSSLVFSIDIHPAAVIAGGLMIDHGTGVVIGETSIIGENVSILQNVTLGGTGKIEGDRHPKIQSGVLIGAGANILGNITIGLNSKIGAGSVVLKDIPPYSTAVGIPAEVVATNPPDVIPGTTIDQIY